MRLLVLVVGLLVVLAPARTRADAQIAEWIGDYAMIHDGHRGTLRIADSKADCATTPWCHLVVAYTGPDGRRHGARIRQIDQRFQHMALDIAFPGNMQRFDAYIMSWDKARIAGTTVWGGRTFGFYAIKNSRPAIARPVPERPELATPGRTVCAHQLKLHARVAPQLSVGRYDWVMRRVDRPTRGFDRSTWHHRS